MILFPFISRQGRDGACVRLRSYAHTSETSRPLLHHHDATMASSLFLPVLYFSLFLITMVPSVTRAYSRTILTRFVLIETHHKGNVGAAARSLKTMGFDDLVLVKPRDTKVLNRQRTKEAASGATDVLEKARVVNTLEEALEGITAACATAMPHDMSISRPSYTFEAPRVHFEKVLSSNEEEDIRIAFLFGNERVGMSEEDIGRCDAVLGIPTNPVSFVV